MNYLYVSKKSKPRSRRGVYFAAIIIALIIFVLIIGRLSVFSIFTSWWKGETAFLQSAAVSTSWFADKAKLALRIEELENENQDLKALVAYMEAKNIAYDDLALELHTTYSTPLSASSSTTTTPITHIGVTGALAKIVRRPPFTVFDTYVIDKGEGDAVAIGDGVYARGIQVGTVKSVTMHSALVHLYSSPGEKVIVSFGTTTSQYEAYGIGNATLKADVPRDERVEEGMFVTVGDRNASIVGKISAIDREDAATTKSIFITLPFDIEETDWLIIKRPQE